MSDFEKEYLSFFNFDFETHSGLLHLTLKTIESDCYVDEDDNYCCHQVAWGNTHYMIPKEGGFFLKRVGSSWMKIKGDKVYDLLKKRVPSRFLEGG